MKLCAEIGQNHNGDPYLALRLMMAAERAGADIVKFQLRDAENEFTEEELDAEYIGVHGNGPTVRAHRAATDLTIDQLVHLKRRHEYNECRTEFVVTPCSVRAVGWLEREDLCTTYKIASKDIRNAKLLEAVGRTGRDIILSTGHVAPGDTKVLDDACWLVNPTVICHCVSEYPTSLSECRLRELHALNGYSDHSVGIDACKIAMCKPEVEYIEKHITMSHDMRGRDHRGSATPEQFAELVRWRDLIAKTL